MVGAAGARRRLHDPPLGADAEGPRGERATPARVPRRAGNRPLHAGRESEPAPRPVPRAHGVRRPQPLGAGRGTGRLRGRPLPGLHGGSGRPPRGHGVLGTGYAVGRVRARSLRLGSCIPAGGRRHRGGMAETLGRVAARRLFLGEPGGVERGSARPADHFHDPVCPGGDAGGLGCPSGVRRRTQFGRGRRGVRERGAFARRCDAARLSPGHAAAAGGRLRPDAGDRPRPAGRRGSTEKPPAGRGGDRLRELARQHRHLREGSRAAARDGRTRPARPAEPADSREHRIPFRCHGSTAGRRAAGARLPERMRLRRRRAHGVLRHGGDGGASGQRLLVVQHPEPRPLRHGDGDREAGMPPRRGSGDRPPRRATAPDPAVPGSGRPRRGLSPHAHEG